MSMSWLIILFILNGTPAIVDEFQPRLVLTSECPGLEQIVGRVMALSFPETEGMVFCILDNRSLEAPDVTA